MTTFAIVHGAGGSAWEWHLVAAELQARGHQVIARDLPCEDDSMTFGDYADVVVDAVGGRSDVVVVAHSLGGFTGPLVAARLPGASLVLAAAMIPRPGEPAGDWWAATGHAVADEGDDAVQAFMADLSPALAAEALAHAREQSATPMAEPWPLDAWPDVPTRAVLFADDRFFPLAFMRGLYRDRLGITDPTIVPGSHCAYLGHPVAVASALAP